MVTIYGTENTKPEDMPALLLKRKMVHPVLLDPTSAYDEALELAAYPVGTLLDRKGQVVWQGVAWRKAFDKELKAQIERLLETAEEKAAGRGEPPR